MTKTYFITMFIKAVFGATMYMASSLPIFFVDNSVFVCIYGFVWGVVGMFIMLYGIQFHDWR